MKIEWNMKNHLFLWNFDDFGRIWTILTCFGVDFEPILGILDSKVETFYQVLCGKIVLERYLLSFLSEGDEDWLLDWRVWFRTEI